jgi:hypothetical protein
MGWLYLGQDRGMMLCAVCISVRIWGRVCGLAVSRSGWGCENMGWQYLGQDRGMVICACSI